jgi:uncharacterized protein YuzE
MTIASHSRGRNQSSTRDLASLEFDREVGALYLRLRKDKVSSSEPLADNMVVDLDSKKKIVGFEFLLPPAIKKEIKAQLGPPSNR